MNRITIKEYFATAGSRLTDRDARVIGPVLAELSQARDLDAAAVVQAAHSANCPLHAYFEWDDKAAADQYRIGQAEEIINTVRVRYVSDDDGQERTVRAYRIAHAKADPTPPTRRESLPKESAELDEDEIMGDALRELQQWRLKYRPYAEMLGEFKDVATVILNQIAEFIDEFNGSQSAAKPLEAVEDLKLWAQRHGATTGAAAQFAEQFRYMMQAIEDAEKAFDPDAMVEGPLARENRMLRERIAELEGNVAPILPQLQATLGLTKSQANLVAVLLERENVTKEAMLRAMYPNRSEEELPQEKTVDVLVCKVRDKLNSLGIEITTNWGSGYCMSPASKARLNDMIGQKAEAA